MFEEKRDFDIANRLFYLFLFFFSGLLLYLFLSLIYQFRSLGEKGVEREITFSAEERISPKPEFALLSFAVITRGLKVDETQRLNDEKRDSLFAALAEFGVPREEIKETKYNISLVSDTSLGMRVQKFQVTKEYEAKVKDLERLSAMIKKIGEKGGVLVPEVKFLPEDMEKLRGETRFLLISRVKNKAQRVAKEAGFALGEVVGLKEEVIPQEKGEEILKITLTYTIR